MSLNDTSKTYILNLFNVRFPVRASAEAVPDTGLNAGQQRSGSAQRRSRTRP